jgi:ribosomal protein L37AE/L43A
LSKAQNIDILASCNSVVLEAKCPQCGRKAHVDDDMEKVKCEHCSFSSTYDEYLEIMKGKAVMMADDFQMNWDKNPF